MSPPKLPQIYVSRHNIIDHCAKIYLFLCDPPISFYKARKLLYIVDGTIGPQESESLSSEPIGNKEGRQGIWQRTPIRINSPKLFHLNRLHVFSFSPRSNFTWQQPQGKLGIQLTVLSWQQLQQLSLKNQNSKTYRP
jgi:hypothetical protein